MSPLSPGHFKLYQVVIANLFYFILQIKFIEHLPKVLTRRYSEYHIPEHFHPEF